MDGWITGHKCSNRSLMHHGYTVQEPPLSNSRGHVGEALMPLIECNVQRYNYTDDLYVTVEVEKELLLNSAQGGGSITMVGAPNLVCGQPSSV
jgi:hypothetical protein